MTRSSGSRHGEALVEVELDEAGTPESEPTAEGGERPRRRWFTSPALIGVIVLVLLTVTVNAVDLAKERARRAALAAIPGILRPLTDPLAPVWERDGYQTGWGLDVLLLQNGDVMDAVDPTTGETLWSREMSGDVYCDPIGQAAVDEAAGSVDPSTDSAGPRLLGCRTWNFDLLDIPDDATAALDVIDATTGEVVRTMTAPGQFLMTQSVEEDVVLVAVGPDGHATVIRWDPTEPEPEWQATTTETVLAPGSEEYPWADLRSGAVVIGTERHEVAFAVEDGQEIPPPDVEADPWHLRHALPDGGEIRWSYESRGRYGTGHGEVVDADGALRFELAERPLVPWLDDGSAPEVIVVGDHEGDVVRGLDPRSGEELWAAEELGLGEPMLLMDGVLVLQVASDVVALDVRDGTTRWTVRTVPSVASAGLTDGELMLVAEVGGTERQATWELVARSIQDGSERWRAPLPHDVQWISPGPQGTVIGSTSRGSVGFG